MTDAPNWLNAAGIALDIVGAIWIAKGLAFVRSADLIDLSRERPGSPASVAIGEQQRLDSRCGLAVLIAGFTMQLVGVLIPTSQWWIASGCAGIVALAVYVYYFRTKRRVDETRQQRIGSYTITKRREEAEP